MTDKEAIAMALEALEGFYEYGYDRQECFEHITAIKEALLEHAMQEVQRLGQEIEQEPVAIKRMKEWIEYLKRKSDFGQHMKIPSEMSAGTCWELAIELEQFINTTPPQRTEPVSDDIASILACRDMLDAQPVPEFDRVIWPERTWVGLTDEEREEIHGSTKSPYLDLIVVEAKLKEKNT